jgi:hypothetical protein
MKTLLACLTFVAFFAFSSYAQEIKFDALDVNYGNIERGADGVRNFKFTNTGKAPLIISDAKGSCGCTVPTYPKEPIMPGESAEIKVKYDTNRIGAFTKYVTLTTNATNETSTKLKIHGTINSEAAPTPDAPKSLFNQ